MSKVDQFESVFKAAVKTLFAYESVELRSALLLTDLEAGQAQAFAERVRAFLRSLHTGDELDLQVVPGNELGTVQQMLELVAKKSCDLVCTYRNLHSDAWRWPYSVGNYLAVLSQETRVPVLVLPNPRAEEQDPRDPAWDADPKPEIMALTHHLTGDHRLVNIAVQVTPRDGKLVLAHVEDDAVFEQYLDVISKIPAIDTDLARETIGEQLLKEPRDYIQSAIDALKAAGVPLGVEASVTTGHRLSEYVRLIEEHEIDLLVMHGKDEDQQAMHGLAYPLVVELLHLPLLII